MNFVYSNYIPLVILATVLIFFFTRRFEKGFFLWVEDHWFLKRSRASKLSSLLKFFAFALLLTSLLDLRGQEEKVETNIPDQKTIILIDKSASMLVEDVRPNRFKKAIMLARHFVKKAAGHQISIIVFSDTHKRVVPFTDDIDLLDSILGGLLDLNIAVGGSELSMAMKEAIGYFSLDKNYSGGNLLVFTDGEEHDSFKNMKLEKDVNLAIIGIGTLKGGPIPIRRRDGGFSGYKKHKGKQIKSALNEKFIQSFVNKTKNAKYWISLSYSLPTDEVLDFFRTRFQSKLSKGESRIRPVLAKNLLIPAVIIYIFSYLFSLGSTFSVMSSLVILMLITPVDKSYAQNKESGPVAQQTERFLEKMKNGKISEGEKLKLAENLLRLDKPEKAQLLYEEVIKDTAKHSNGTLINMATAYLKNKKFAKAVNIFDELKSRSNLSKQEKKIVENNTLRALNQKSSKKGKSGKDDKKSKDKKDKNKDKKESSESEGGNEGKDKKDQNDQESDQDKKKKNGKGKDKDKDKDKDKNKDQDDKQDGDSDKKDSDKKKKSVKDKENEIAKKRKMIKIPATLKQIMNDDRSLRKRHLKTTIGKDKRSERKDW
ncbi:hypothetical protein A9Q84_21335 [Halobacteriovorax marinus]|uniref:VWFA domain-containing protein n=1 Tax=Halobacteriovorax marinus TaxID=97084 RepID=A0A1Y5F718_9BACT|nr:hypothetical protein A9Q84_21335 [Halobacteriovorax marinus]